MVSLCRCYQGCTEGPDQCHEWQFQCTNGNCVFSNWECDGETDCHDGSDEHDGCHNSTAFVALQPEVPRPSFPSGECNEWMYKCESSQCVPYWWKCDGVADCDDASDERECGGPGAGRGGPELGRDSALVPVSPPVLGCSRGKFQCDSGDCIWAAWVCDGEKDCAGGEDEVSLLGSVLKSSVNIILYN